MDDPKPWLALARVPGLHAGRLARDDGPAIAPLALLEAPRTTLTALGFHEAAIAALRHPDRDGLASDERWLAGGHRTLVTWGSPAYPAALAAIEDAPLALFVEGDPQVLSLPQLAIVGSRNPTAIGRDTATRFAAQLARDGLAVTSGLALGIDGAAHRGALSVRGHTIAVLGCGLDAVYPREHAALAREIVAQGALVSEMPTGTAPLRHHFPRRNRIISGLSAGTLVVEAALQSGSLITARLAGEQGREVFAIPGSIHSPQSRGCHALIKQGAKLVECAEDVLEELRFDVPARAAPAPEPAAGGDGDPLLDALGFDPVSLDALVARTGESPAVLGARLLELELSGEVARLPGQLFQRIGRA